MFRQNQSQRTGPKCVCQLFGQFRNIRCDRRQLIAISDMHNQRIKTRTLFGFEDSCDCGCVKSIGPETVNRFRWKRHKVPSLQKRCSFYYVCPGSLRSFQAKMNIVAYV